MCNKYVLNIPKELKKTNTRVLIETSWDLF